MISTSPAQNPVTATVFLKEILVDRFKNERLHLALTQPDSTTANLTSCTVKNGDRLEVLGDAVLAYLTCPKPSNCGCVLGGNSGGPLQKRKTTSGPDSTTANLTSCTVKNGDRLEVLGDAVLGLLVSIGLYRTFTKYKPGDLIRHRSALTCNDSFGVLSVKFGIHKFLLGMPPSLLHNANKFVENQEEASHPYSNKSYSLARSTPQSSIAARCIKVPVVLADVFESVTGAIFIDSKASLTALQNSFQPFFNDANDQYGSCILDGYFHRDVAVKSRKRFDHHLIFAMKLSLLRKAKRWYGDSTCFTFFLKMKD
ncbi:hypothetical protein DAPPUDRAFT_318955 [Daphnia pulex]|uniref:RNase III domain-containing protein n=1 Tax=Daphnia pulex TaxID=6669 RepID=E9GK86_DAPPU|nr:hypothetical protein DAPPUDRAFT_318955 [Daphnia pulex]|eukprot:EFX79946.1 hypothetical protein DAPPUDRAFT_318955 [Daphnia pulex]